MLELLLTVVLRSSDTFSNFTVKPIHSSCFPVSSHWQILLESLQSSGQVLIKALYTQGLQQLFGLSIKHLNHKWNTLKIIENNLIIDNNYTQYNEI